MKSTRWVPRRSLWAGVCVISLVAFVGVLLFPVESSALIPVSQRKMLEEYWLSAFPGQPTMVGGRPPAHVLAKAQPDECYNGIGNPYPPGPPCAQGKPKVNHSYVWGLAKDGPKVWFGTGVNILCVVFGTFLGEVTPYENDSWVCEFGESQPAKQLGIPAAIGDTRVPRIFRYDTTTKALVNLSPVADPLFRATLGMRSAGTHDGVVFLGGPGMPSGVNLFAFNVQTGAYLGSKNFPTYSNIRKFVVVDGVLYNGVGTSAGPGRVLRWRGSLADPFQFEEVGIVDNDAVELAEHEGRLFVTTWPTARTDGSPTPVPGLFMGPPIPAGGYTAADLNSWVSVWRNSDYEPDPLMARIAGGGALRSYGGYLYWGTMHVPFTGATYFLKTYGTPPTPDQLVAMVYGTQRAISIFRGKNFGAAGQEMSLVYGMPVLPVYFPPTYDPELPLGGWRLLPNKMGQPLLGMAGFGNFFNNYTWTMAGYKDRLYVGTMDWSYLWAKEKPFIVNTVVSGLVEMIFLGTIHWNDLDPEQKVSVAAILTALGYNPATLFNFPPSVYGADLLRFTDTTGPALAESLDGVGNWSSYGVRTMLADDQLYLGMANPMNLMTDPNDNLPQGGWELLGLKNSSPVPLFILDEDASSGGFNGGSFIK